MAISRAMYEQEVLNELRDVPLAQFPKVLHLLHVIKEEFLTTSFRNEVVETEAVGQEGIANAVSVVKETWGNIPLDREMAKYIAEDKELEYEVD